MSNFKNEISKKINLIYCPPSLGLTQAEEFKDLAKAWLLAPVDAHILDFKSVQLIARPFYQAFLQFRSTLKKDEKSVFSINVNNDLLKQIRADGLESSFNPVPTLQEAQKKMGSIQESKNQIDLEFIGPFLTGAKSAFEIQCNTPIRPQKPFIKKAPVENIAIAGVLSLASDQFQGTVILSFPEKVFLKIYRNMFDEEHSVITKEIEDAAGELLNIVYGAAKVELNQKGYNFPKSLPAVMTGKEIKIRQLGNVTTVVLPFESDVGTFYLEIEWERS